jgi:hypothetical protein
MGYQLLTVTANGNDPAGLRVFSGSDNRNAECDQRSVTKMPGLYHRPSKYSRTAFAGKEQRGRALHYRNIYLS